MFKKFIFKNIQIYDDFVFCTHLTLGVPLQLTLVSFEFL